MANFITIFRIFLVFLSAYFLYGATATDYIIALVLTIIAFALDGLDGWVARKFNESSKLGAVLDIMSDRIAENVYWVVFAALGFLPVVFPIVALTRSFVVDSLRSVAMEKGYTAFGEMSMQSDKWGYLICSSKFSRISYAVAKVLAFVLIIAGSTPGISFVPGSIMYLSGYILAFIAIEFCVLRGLPVVFESRKFFEAEANK